MTMKKDLQKRTLTLKTETIKVLTLRMLGAVIGGLPTANTTSLRCQSFDSECTC
jgi:hypothetical protein